jgi:hypothetical protein
MASQQDDPMDIAEQSVTPEFAVIDEVVRAHAPDFAARGFILMNVAVEGPPRVLRTIVFHFSNPSIGLLLDVSSFLGRSGVKRGFNAMIIAPGNRTLNVHDYLVRHERSEEAQSLTNEAPSDVRAFAESSVRLFLDLLDGALKPVVEGKTFEETPIDWAGYK